MKSSLRSNRKVRYFANIALVVTAVVVIACGGGGGDIGGGNSSSGGSSTSGGNTTSTGGTTSSSSTGNTGSTLAPPRPQSLTSSTPGGTLSSAGSWSTLGFDLPSSTYIWWTTTAQYSTNSGLITASTIDAFRNGGTYNGYHLFSAATGWKSGTVPAGSYFAAIRNNTSNANSIYTELSSINATNTEPFTQHASQVVNLASGARAWMGITIDSGYTTFLNGSNTGVRTDIIPAAQLDAFRSGGTYQRYTAYANDTRAKGHPLHWRLNDNLPPGTYYAVAYNDTSQPQAITQWAIKWRTTNSERSRTLVSPSITTSAKTIFDNPTEDPINFLLNIKTSTNQAGPNE